jgi:hypothetical protein
VGQGERYLVPFAVHRGILFCPFGAQCASQIHDSGFCGICHKNRPLDNFAETAVMMPALINLSANGAFVMLMSLAQLPLTSLSAADTADP